MFIWVPSSQLLSKISPVPGTVVLHLAIRDVESFFVQGKTEIKMPVEKLHLVHDLLQILHENMGRPLGIQVKISAFRLQIPFKHLENSVFVVAAVRKALFFLLQIGGFSLQILFHSQCFTAVGGDHRGGPLRLPDHFHAHFIHSVQLTHLVPHVFTDH